ncbi:MAG: ACP S-malonyltransferase [Acidobacteriota bacterium]
MDVCLQFPGQLSEHVGMGSVVLARLPSRRLEQAEARTGLPLGRLWREGPEGELHRDRAAAVSMIACNQMTLDALQACDVRVLAVIGHSLGYTSALVAAGCLRFEEALDVVIAFEDAMDRKLARDGFDGAMGVIVGLVEAEVERIAREAGAEVACRNAKTQGAISGPRTAVTAALDAARACGALATHLMPMGRAMHSSHMNELCDELERSCASVPVRAPAIAIWSHVAAEPIRTAEAARALLARQVSQRVRWWESIAALAAAHPGAPLLECGPGDVLTRLARWIDRRLPARPLSSEGAWKELPVRAETVARD